MKLRAASLIEVFVALTISAIVLTSAMAVFSVAVKNARLANIKGELEREGSFLQELLERDLRATGLGLPRGNHLVDGYDGAGASSLYGPVILAIPDAVGVVADLPAPHASYNTFGTLSTLVDHDSFAGEAEHLFWFNENNGFCQPDGSNGAGATCTTGQTSVFFPGLDGCTNGGVPADRMCTWGLRRLLPGQRFQVVFGDGGWATSAGSLVGPLHTIHGLVWYFTGTTIAPGWEVNAPAPAADLPSTAPSQGFVTTLDRVFYFRDGALLRRQQCEGDPDATDADWPDDTGAAMPANPENVQPGTVQNACTEREILARNVDAVVFSYFDGLGAPITNIDTAAEKNAVRSIGYAIRLKKTFADGAGSTDVLHELSGRVGLRNP